MRAGYGLRPRLLSKNGEYDWDLYKKDIIKLQRITLHSDDIKESKADAKKWLKKFKKKEATKDHHAICACCCVSTLVISDIVNIAKNGLCKFCDIFRDVPVDEIQIPGIAGPGPRTDIIGIPLKDLTKRRRK